MEWSLNHPFSHADHIHEQIISPFYILAGICIKSEQIRHNPFYCIFHLNKLICISYRNKLDVQTVVCLLMKKTDILSF